MADSLFLTLLGWFKAYCFLLFGGIAAVGGFYSYLRVPETKGRTLAEVQVIILIAFLPHCARTGLVRMLHKTLHILPRCTPAS